MLYPQPAADSEKDLEKGPNLNRGMVDRRQYCTT